MKFLPEAQLTVEAFRKLVKEYPIIESSAIPGHIIFAYLVMFKELMMNPDTDLLKLISEARGSTFNSAGKLVRRTMAKFNNLNDSMKIDWENVILLEKLDGSMVAPFIFDAKVVWATKKAISESAENFVNIHTDDIRYNDLVLAYPEYTFTFEWCSPNNKIIINYQEDSLTLISMRNIETGEYVNYEQMTHFASQYNIPIVNIVEGVDFSEITNLTAIEGCVAVDKNKGQPLCKIKTSWYFEAHKLNDYLNSSGNHLWDLIILQEIDDHIPKMTQEVREMVVHFIGEFNASLVRKRQEIEDVAEELKSMDKKKLYQTIKSRIALQSSHKIYLAAVKSGRIEAEDILRHLEFLVKGKKYSDISEFLGIELPKFEE